MEKSYPAQEGHLPSRVNFSERLHEKKVALFARVKSWPRMLSSSPLGRVDPAGRAKVFTWRKVSSTRRMTLLSKQGDPVRKVTPFFASHVNGSSSLVSKCRKSWLAQGSSGYRVTISPGTTFLNINGLIVLCSFVLRKIRPVK